MHRCILPSPARVGRDSASYYFGRFSRALPYPNTSHLITVDQGQLSSLAWRIAFQPDRQRGVVLVMSLMVLVIVTMLGLTSTDSSTTNLLLARNLQLKERSFQNAESALIIAEQSWLKVVSDCVENYSHCRTNIFPPFIQIIDDADWENATVAVHPDDSVSAGDYLVEYCGWRPIIGEGKKRVLLYRLTVRTYGPSETRLQTLLALCVTGTGQICLAP